MRSLLLFTTIIAMSSPAWAQSTITVVGDDGKTTTVEIEPPMMPAPSAAAPASPKVTQDAPPEKPQSAPAVRPSKKPAAPAQAAQAKTPPKKPAAPAPKAAKKTPSKTDKTKSAHKAPPQKPAQKTAQKKQPVPESAPKSASAPSPAADAPRLQRLGEAMSPDDAIRIALDAAPPSRSVHATPVNHNGLHTYQVVFKTEDGDRSIFVDRETGKIVK